MNKRLTTETAAWHAGEVALQQTAGAAEQLAAIGTLVIHDHMPQQHRDFFAQLPFLVVGALDAAGQPWASALAGAPGFVSSPHARQLHVQAVTAPYDPLGAALVAGAPVGLLGIEPQTRRRNRMNGVVEAVGPQGFSVGVRQSFGNCPKYIQARQPEFTQQAGAAAHLTRGTGLDDAARRSIAQADTLFIATAHPDSALGVAAQGVDVSHRGGRPGFVRVEGDTLTVPDFMGNFFFNTLGNLLLNPRCGLLLIDYDGGALLHLAATGEIVTDAAEVAVFEGAQRLLRLRIRSMLRVEPGLALRWSAAQLSPHLQATGAWS